MYNARRNVFVLAAILLSIPALTQAGIISSGTVTIPGTDDFDFDAGLVITTFPDLTGDVFWDISSPTSQNVLPWNGTTLVNLGSVSFGTITLGYLEAQTYSSAGINNSLLVTGDVFAVITDLGNYAAAEVTGPIVSSDLDYGLPIQWETFAASTGVPEPGQLPLVGAAIAACLIGAWRKR
jgi:hypothetical protein